MTSKQFRGPLAASFLAAAASVALLASPVQAAPPHLTTAVNNALAEAQKASNAGDMATAKADLDKANAVSGKTDNDSYMIAKVTIAIAVKGNDMATAEAAAEVAANSPAAPPEDKASNLRTALILTNNLKMTDKAVAFAKQMQATNPTDPQLVGLMVAAFYNGKDFADASAVVQKQMATETAGGKKPSRETLQNLLDIQVAQQDEAGAEKTLEDLVADYNDPKDWSQMIDVAMGTKGLRDQELVWLGRLLFVAGATPSAQDLTLLGSTADHLTFYGDAEIASKHGGTGFADDTAKADADKKTIPQQIAAEPKQNANYSAKLAEALYSYGMYPEAEAAARLAMSKGAAPDPTEAPMVLGQSLVAEGKYDDAIAAFGQVNGGGPATQRITRLWVDYCNIKKNPPAAAAPATAAAAPAK